MTISFASSTNSKQSNRSLFKTGDSGASTGCDRSTSEDNGITILAITWNKIVANHRVKEAREHR